MSYDISVLNVAPGVPVGKRELTERLAQLGWHADSETHFVLQGAEGVSADMDLAWLENGTYLEPRELVNCLQVHIPSAFVESSRAEVLNNCRNIARTLAWRIYDEQQGAYLG